MHNKHMNLRRYWPTLFALGYVLLMGLWLFGSYTRILPTQWSVLSGETTTMILSFVALQPFDLIIFLLPNGAQWGHVRLLSGFAIAGFSGWFTGPSLLGWFFASLVIIGLVFTANHFITEWWSRRGTSKSNRSF